MKDAQQSCVFVIGMHRSGTSALAGCLDILGHNLGNDLLSTTIDNPKGYFESKKINNLNDSILASLGYTWQTPFRFQEQILQPTRHATLVQTCKAILEELISQNELIVIKDPRISVLLPLWQEACNQLNIVHKYIICLRNPAEIAASLSKRDGFTNEKSYILWLNYLHQVEYNTRLKPRIFINFDDLLRQPLDTLNSVSNVLSLSHVHDLKSSILKIEDFLETSLKRHNKVNHTLPNKVGSFYTELTKLSKLDEGYQLIDELRAEYIQEHDLFYNKNITDVYFADSDNEKSLYAQLYIDSGEGFKESESLRVRIDSKSTIKTIEFTIPKVTSIKRLRFDPVNTYAQIKFKSIKTQNSLGEWEKIDGDFRTNAMSIQKGTFLFDTKDPNIFFSQPINDIQKIKFELNYQYLGKPTFAQIVVAQKEKLHLQTEKSKQEKEKSTQKINALNTDIKYSKQELHLVNQRIIDLQNLISANKEIIIFKDKTIVDKENTIANKDKIISDKDSSIQNIQNNLSRIQSQLNDQKADNTRLLHRQNNVSQSLSYRLGNFITLPFRFVYDTFKANDNKSLGGKLAAIALAPFAYYKYQSRLKHHDPRANKQVIALSKVLKIPSTDIVDALESTPGNRDFFPFDEDYYTSHYADVISYANNDKRKIFQHWLHHGIREGRVAAATFNPKFYLDKHPGIAESAEGDYYKALEHWLLKGIKEGKQGASPDTDIKQIVEKFYDEIDGNIALANSKKTIFLVAHAVGNYLYGGARSYVDIANLINKDLYNVVAILPRKRDEFVDLLKPYTSKIVIFNYQWWTYDNQYNEDSVEKFRRIIRLFDAKLIHANTIMLQDVMKAAKLEQITAATHVRELISKDKPLQEKLAASSDDIIALVKDTSDYIIANSETTLEEFDKGNDQSFVVPNLVTQPFFEVDNEINPNEIKIGLISSNIEKKGVNDFVALANEVGKVNDKIKFYLIGQETPLTTKLKEDQKQGLVSKNVIFYGYTENALDAHKALDIVVNFSHFAESFGRTIAEAMAAKRPTIIYDYGALPELVNHGETGYIIPYKDWKAAVPFIIDLANNPDKINILGEAGRQKALSSVSKDIISQKLDGIYEKILGQQITSAAAAKFDDKELKIAYFVWHFPVPSETFVLNELKYLSNNGYDVKVYCRQSPYKDFTPDFDISWEQVTSPEDLAQKFISSGRTIAHSIFVYPTVTEFLYPACQKANIPFTFAAHAAGIFKYENIEKNKINEIVNSNLCLGVMIPGNFHLGYLTNLKVPKNKLILNPQVFDNHQYDTAKHIDHIHTRTKKICAIGRFVEKKGYEYLIKAAAQLPDYQFNIYGYGDLEETYRKLIKEYNLHNVFLPGKLNGAKHIIEIFNQHDLFIQPSVRATNGDMDGIPTILMEAMAAGIPVITTPISSIPSLVVDNINGFYCEGKNEDSIVRAIQQYYNSSPAKIRAIIDSARLKLNKVFNIEKSMDILRWTWSKKTIDIIIVSYNNLPELQEVVRRVFEYTSTPFRLIIVDNASNADVVNYLRNLETEYKQVTVKFQNQNLYVGPGTNVGIENSHSKYLVYLCGKEGFILKHSWELDIIYYLNNHPDVGMAGSLGYSPTYMTGKDYPTGIKLFDKFRNKEFATRNPNRIFKHVQGGLFALRRSMVEEIGGFSNQVYHNYTDVEYSYYVESMGWKLGEIPELLSLYNKTRPGLLSKLDENIVAAHPFDLDMLPLVEHINKQRQLCNICEWQGVQFDYQQNKHICPSCKSDDRARALYRYLAESTFTYRRLPALSINVPSSLKEFWVKNFQGKTLSSTEIKTELKHKKGKLDNKSNGIKLILLNNVFLPDESMNNIILQEIYRIMSPTGTLIAINNYDNNNSLSYQDLKKLFAKNSLILSEEKLYQSSVLNFDYHKLLIYKKTI